jgi:hypothetical protein
MSLAWECKLIMTAPDDVALSPYFEEPSPWPDDPPQPEESPAARSFRLWCEYADCCDFYGEELHRWQPFT